MAEADEVSVFKFLLLQIAKLVFYLLDLLVLGPIFSYSLVNGTYAEQDFAKQYEQWVINGLI